MATDYWASSHQKRWIVDRASLRMAREDDLRFATAEQLALLGIFFADAISKLGKKLSLKQRAIATATVFFRRFYLKNSYCDTEPFIVLSSCCYLAAKAEESPVHIKNVVVESRSLFSSEYGIRNFPSDNSKLAEMEFYLVDDLECDLTVFHPYRSLLALCGLESGATVGEAGEVGTGIEDGERYWGTGECKIDFEDGALQMAWFIINDTYRSDLCLLYPPFLIAIAALYLTLVLHGPTRATLPTSSQAQTSDTSTPRYGTRQTSSQQKAQHQDPITFLANLNVSLSVISTITQEIISLYSLWDRFSPDESDMTGSARKSASSTRSVIGPDTVTSRSLTELTIRMREARDLELSHPTSARQVAINKRLERVRQPDD